jgi:hypothetical protein
VGAAGRRVQQWPTWAQLLVPVVVVALVGVAAGIRGGEDAVSNNASTRSRDATTSPRRGGTPPPVTNAPATTTPPAGTHVERPVPKGAAIPASSWKFTIVDFNADATAAVLRFSQSNRTPLPGEHYAALRVRADYVGSGVGNPLLAPSIDLIGLLHVSYRPASVTSGAGGDAGELQDSPPVPSGGSAEGWIYYLVSNEDGGLVCWVPNAAHSLVPGEIAFFAIQ